MGQVIIHLKEEKIRQIMRQKKDSVEIINDLLEIDIDNQKDLIKMKFEILRDREKENKMNEREKDNHFYNQFISDCKKFNITFDEKEVKKIFDLKVKDMQ